MRPATLERPISSGDGASPAVASARSVGALIEALTAWLDAPSAAHRRRLGAALERFVEEHGSSGAYLQLHPGAWPELAVGAGSVRRRPGRIRARGLARRTLLATDRTTLGVLWVAGPPEVAVAAARAIEVALEWARARDQAWRAHDRLAALDEATRAIAGILSLERVLQLIVDNVRRLVGAEYAALGILDESRRPDPFITSGVSRAARERIGAPPRGRGLLGLVVEAGRPVRVDDISHHPRRSGFPPNHPPMHTFLGVPISSRGRLLGHLYLADRMDGRPFSEEDERLVEQFASHAGIAIESARLHEQEQRLAILEERQRIGRDLHDGIIQSIYAVGLQLDDAFETVPESPEDAQAKIEHAIESLNLTIRDIRNFIFGLRPEPLDQAGLMDALAAMAEEFRVNTMVDISLVVRGEAHVELSGEETIELLQLTREALSNVARHARAERAEIVLTGGDGVLELSVIDDGVGFDPTARRGPGHMGLSNMRARAEQLGGELLVESAVGRGTRVVARVPWDATRTGHDDGSV